MNKIDPDAVHRSLEKVSAGLGKSDSQRKLLQFLTERGLSGDTPKELEIAMDVFGKDASFNSAEDATVRVNVRTLRQKLEEYYRGPGKTDPLRLEIPKGGYRVTFVPQDTAADVALAAPPPEGGRAASRAKTRWILAVLALALTLSLLANVWLSTKSQSPVNEEVRDSFVWAPITSSTRPLTIVLGDLPLYSTRDPHTGQTLLVRHPLINSTEQLRAYIARFPDLAELGQLRQTTLVPKSVVYGLTSILPLVSRADRTVEVTILDELQLNDIRDKDIIYIGPLVRLGPLADHFFRTSRYKYDADNYRLTDSATHKTFGMEGGEERITDQGLFATLPGPSQNHFMIFASVARDIGLLQVIRSMTSPAGITTVRRRLTQKSPNVPSAFEVLMNVSGYKRTDLNAEIIDAHALTLPAVDR